MPKATQHPAPRPNPFAAEERYDSDPAFLRAIKAMRVLLASGLTSTDLHSAVDLARRSHKPKRPGEYR